VNGGLGGHAYHGNDKNKLVLQEGVSSVVFDTKNGVHSKIRPGTGLEFESCSGRFRNPPGGPDPDKAGAKIANGSWNKSNGVLECQNKVDASVKSFCVCVEEFWSQRSNST
jgi:hypothetical protein